MVDPLVIISGLRVRAMGLRVGDENDAQRALGKLVFILCVIFVGGPVTFILSRYLGLGGLIGAVLGGATGGLVGYGLNRLLAMLFGKTHLGEETKTVQRTSKATATRKRKVKPLRQIEE